MHKHMDKANFNSTRGKSLKNQEQPLKNKIYT